MGPKYFCSRVAERTIPEIEVMSSNLVNSCFFLPQKSL